jgi:hypothetical protein
MLFYEALEKVLVSVLEEATGIKFSLGIKREGHFPGDYFVYGYVSDAEKALDSMEWKIESEVPVMAKALNTFREFQQKYPEGENIDDPRGFYHPMQSPGYIGILIEPNVRLLQSMLIKQKPRVDWQNIAGVVSLALVVLLDTFYHEYFHYFCDILRKTHEGVLPHSLHEEALATAFSYRMLFSSVPSIGTPCPGWGTDKYDNYDRYEYLLHQTIKPFHNLRVESNILTESGKVSFDTDSFFNFAQDCRVETLLFRNLPNGYNQYANYISSENFYKGIDQHLFNGKLEASNDSYDARILIEAQLSTILAHLIDIQVI